MKFSIELTDSAIDDIDYFPKKERRLLVDAITLYLTHDANVETRRRKKLLQPNPLSEWELRIDNYRVFYNIESGNTVKVKVVAVGRKEHNDLYIRGQEVDL